MAVNMPPSEFTPMTVSDNSRLWKSDIGLMNTSKTNVVFTIDSLIAFLKTHQVEVDSNLNEFKNLPKFAAFGKMAPINVSTSQSVPSAPAAGAASEVPAAPTNEEAAKSASSQDSKHDAETSDVSAPLQQQAQTHVPASAAAASKIADPDVFIPTRKVRQPPGGGTLTIGNLFGGDDEPVQNRRVVSNGSSVIPENTPFAGQGFVPTRKVREPPGGVSTVGAIIFGS